jgi:hypothetical protein
MPPPVPSGGSRERPISLDTATETADGWEVKVVGVFPKADEAVLKFFTSNQSPRPGKQFYMVRVHAKYLGEGSGSFGSVHRFNALGASSTVYTALDSSCGVIPQDAEWYEEIRQGRSVTGHACWEISSDDADSLEMFHHTFRSLEEVTPSTLESDELIWFALK